MAVQDLQRIEDKLDKAVVGAMPVSDNIGGVLFSSMAEVMEFAKLMSMSANAIPPHLRGNPGACLAVVVQSLEWRFSPFAVANNSYEVNGRIAYESKLIHAVIEARAPLKNRLKRSYTGEGPTRQCSCIGHFKGEVDPVDYTSPMFKDIKIKNSPLWSADPDQQLWYYASRAWARAHAPDVLLGVFAKDDLLDNPEPMQNITPTVGDRLREQKAKSSEGFSQPKITQQMNEVVPDKVGAHREKVSVEVGGSVVTPTQATARPAEPSPDEPRAASVASTNTQADRQSPPEPPRESDDEAMHVLQEAQSGTVAGAEPAKVAKPKREPKPKAAKAETALERGTRLLPAQATKQAVEELQSSIAEELGSAESEQWIALCEARIGELKP